MTSLRDFIAARVEEDRALAQASIDDYNGADDCFFDTGNRYICDHYLRHHPERILRQVKSMQDILDRHGISEGDGCTGCGIYLGRDDKWHPNVAAEDCEDLQALAAIWPEHPDFDPNWSTT